MFIVSNLFLIAICASPGYSGDYATTTNPSDVPQSQPASNGGPVERALEKAGRATGRALDKAAHATGMGVKTAAQETGKGVEKAGEGVHKAGEWVQDKSD